MSVIRKQAFNLCLAAAHRARDHVKVPWALALIAVLLAGNLGLIACGGGGSGSTTIQKVTISASTSSVPITGQSTLTAVVTLNNSKTSTTTTVTWEVNGIANGSSSCGTITPSTDDQLVATYTAPNFVPNTTCGSGLQLGQVAITAVASQSTSSTTGTVTSNILDITITFTLGLAVSPPSASVPAGGTQQFTALLNGVATGASWTLTPVASPTVNPGSIDATGFYTAPPFPPPGNSLTVTATANDDGQVVTATATLTISYSDHTLSGPYAFSYTGNDGGGFYAVDGSFVADGTGNIVSGVEDIQSFLTGIQTEVPIKASTYSVGSDGRGSASIVTSRGTQTWRFALSTNVHAELTRFDNGVSGGGSIDQQNLNQLTNSPGIISGRYVFYAVGTDGLAEGYAPFGMAGAFPADGTGGIGNTDAILDVNDNGISNTGTITRGDTTLSGSYLFDAAYPGTGRGTLTLQSNTIGTGANSRMFAFYVYGTDANCAVVCRVHLVEADGFGFTAGDMYLASTTTGLAAANYVFTTGGNSTILMNNVATPTSYVSGGVFTSDGTSMTTGGTLDINNGGTYNGGASLGSCSYSVDGTTGRIDLGLVVSGSACPSQEFAAYPTALGSVALLELDTSAVSAGLAFQQCGPQSSGCATQDSPSLTATSVSLGLTGQGAFHTSNSALFQLDLDGQATLSGTGNLDINTFSVQSPSDPLGTGTSIGTSGTDGRVTGELAPTNPTATYNIAFYLIDDHKGLVLGGTSSTAPALPIAIGVISRQY